MNNIETLVRPMCAIRDCMTEQTDALNKILKELGLPNFSIVPSIDKVNSQIRSAEKRFTIGFLGTFSAGKSTIINSLLRLYGDRCLSTDIDPDTAKCVRIQEKKADMTYDAEIIYKDGAYPPEKLDWAAAKRFSSEKTLSMVDRQKAELIDEIHYYVDHPFMKLCDILDLPGTGTGRHGEHELITRPKIMECDCVFWVVSTMEEPDKETVKNLESITSKMLPIINVWQWEASGVSSPMTADEIEEILETQYSAYFAHAEKPLRYYAKEIEQAQLNDQELKEEWGKAALIDKVEQILQNIHHGDRLARIQKNLNDALSEAASAIDAMKNSSQIQQILDRCQSQKADNDALKQKLTNVHKGVFRQISTSARQKSEEIIDIIIQASDAFIECEMTGTKLSAIRKNHFKEKLTEEFKKNYLRLDKNWVDAICQEFTEDVNSIVSGAYSTFMLDIMDDLTIDNIDREDVFSYEFVERMCKNISEDIVARLVPSVLSLITHGLLLLIPGLNIIEAISAVISGFNNAKKALNDSKLRAKQEGVKAHSRLQCKQQTLEISKVLKDFGEDFNKKVSKQVEEQLNRDKSETEAIRSLVRDFKTCADLFRRRLDEFNAEVMAFSK